MLVQFILKNVLSFKGETILDMTTVSEEKELQSNLIDYKGKEKFLKVAAIYGANASGKSNLHLAFYYFKEIVKESFNNIDKEELTAIDKQYVPFKFEENRENSEFEYWLYLHFCFSDSALHRDEWNKKLDTLFCQYQLGDGSYQKNYKDIYELVNIDNGVDKAIQNAKRRMEDFYLEK